ncbi:MAG: class A beta-lactamase-related serine hydrolase [Bacteroidota bacterium]|nr:class A beta-lactamase-related serine hydrolase [Bacteroidota bacterium]
MNALNRRAVFQKWIVFLLIIVCCSPLIAQQSDKILTKKLRELVKDFKGDAGIYVHHLKKETIVEINADTLFPTASMIKVPIMIGVMDKVEKGELKYDSLLLYRDSLLYPGDDIIGAFKDSARIELSRVIMLSMTTSDNTGSLWLQYLAGTGIRINELLEHYGLKSTRVNSRTPGREMIRAQFGWGVTTPREMAELVIKIREGKIISPWASERMFRNMSRSYWDGFSLFEIPSYIHAAGKQGFVDRSRSEVVCVSAPHGDYVFCVITKNQKDTSYVKENEGYVLLRNISKTLWQYFEPNDKWHSMPESMKFH